MNRPPAEMDELIALIAQCLVDQPDNVHVKTIKSNATTVMELRVAKEDIGKIIGKKGRTVKAIRTLMGATASKIKKHAILEIIE